MNKSPFYSIRLKDTQEDITDLVTRFYYEESVSKDDLLRLSVNSKEAARLIQEGFLSIGQELIFSFGYIGGKQSGRRLARISGRDRTYGQQVRYELLATDLGLLMKKGQRFDDWSGSTSTQIVRRIAQRNGFLVELQETQKRHISMPQGGKTDFQFLKYLASIEGNGYRFYMQGDTIYFTKRDLLKASSTTYSYSDKVHWIGFSIQERDNTKDGGSKATTIRSVDPITGEATSSTTTARETRQGALGKVTVFVNDRGEEQFASPSVASRAQKEGNVNRVIVGGEHYIKSDVKAGADNYQRTASLSDIQARLSIVGNPLQASDSIITIEGVPDEDAGNWYVDTVAHDIKSGGGYTTAIVLQRNGANVRSISGGNVQNERSKVNKTTGPREQEAKKQVVIVDSNGNEI